MFTLIKLYRAANQGINDQQFETAIKRKILQGISLELKK